MNKIFEVKDMATKKKSRHSSKSFVLHIAEPYGLTDTEVDEIFYSGKSPYVVAGLFIVVEIKK